MVVTFCIIGMKVYFSSFNLLLWNFCLRFLDEEFWEKISARRITVSFLFVAFIWSLFIRCLKGVCCYSYPIFF